MIDFINKLFRRFRTSLLTFIIVMLIATSLGFLHGNKDEFILFMYCGISLTFFVSLMTTTVLHNVEKREGNENDKSK